MLTKYNVKKLFIMADEFCSFFYSQMTRYTLMVIFEAYVATLYIRI